MFQNTWNFIAVESKQVFSLKLWRCWIKACLLSEELTSNAGVLRCMLPMEEGPSNLSFSRVVSIQCDRLLSLMIKQKGCAMCYSYEGSELKLSVLESSGCCWLEL